MKPINNDESLINCCHISAMTQSQRRESQGGSKGEATVTSVKIEIDVVAGAGDGAAVSLQLGYCCCL